MIKSMFTSVHIKQKMQGPTEGMSLFVIRKVFPIIERTIVPLSNRVKQVILLGPLDPEDEDTTVL